MLKEDAQDKADQPEIKGVPEIKGGKDWTFAIKDDTTMVGPRGGLASA
jgi:hypothetical protein